MDEDENYLVHAMDSTGNANVEVAFRGNGSTKDTGTTDTNEHTSNQFSGQNNSCKILQRKLELKVERAKKNFRRQAASDGANVSQIEMSLQMERKQNKWIFCVHSTGF